MAFLRILGPLFLGLLLAAPACTAKGKDKTTIILMRHAEKELTGTDPSLSDAGKKRAAQLPTLLKKYKPDAFYSTTTHRTRQTLQPWAKISGKDIEPYEAAKQDVLAKRLKQTTGKTIVVVGHSNTIPQLANLILGSDTYTDIPDDEFGKVWIITIYHGKATAIVKTF